MGLQACVLNININGEIMHATAKKCEVLWERRSPVAYHLFTSLWLVSFSSAPSVWVCGRCKQIVPFSVYAHLKTVVNFG